jgi:phospholipid/cholesterol/gamma-HCH transport system permease protein
VTVVAMFIMVFGGFAASVFVVGVDPTIYIQMTTESLVEKDLFIGMVKSVFFGVAICWVGVYRGLQVEGGAEGVGRQTTSSVVTSIFLIIVVDLFFTVLFYFV